MASLCRLFANLVIMYTQESIEKLLFGSNRRIINVLEIVRMARFTLEDMKRIFDCTGWTLRAHHRSLVHIHQILKSLQRKQHIPSFIADFLMETRESVNNIEKLLGNIRSTKRFLDRLLEHTFGPLGGRVIIEPCNKRVQYTY